MRMLKFYDKHDDQQSTKIRGMYYYGILRSFIFSCTASMVLDDRGQFAEEEEEGEESDGADGGVILDTTLIENIKNQVAIL